MRAFGTVVTVVSIALGSSRALAAQSVLTCYKAVAMDADSVSDTHATPTAPGVVLTRSTLSVLTDSTYSFLFVFRNSLAQTDTQAQTGRIRPQGHDRNGRILALYKTGATESSTFLTFAADGRMKFHTGGHDFLYVTYAGVCP